MRPRTSTGLRASANRVNVRSLLYILRGLNHYWTWKEQWNVLYITEIILSD